MSNAADVLTGAPAATARGLVVRGVGTFATSSTPVTGSVGTTTRVPTNVANVTLLAANANRLGATIKNNSLTNLFLKLGAVAVIGAGVESFTERLVPQGYYEVPFNYVGIIDGIWDGADAAGEALMTEVTP